MMMMMNVTKLPVIQDLEELISLLLHVKLCEKKGPKDPSSSTS